MTLKTSLILLTLFLLIGLVGFFEVKRLSDRLGARERLIDTLESDQTSLRDAHIQVALDDYARSHSLFSLNYSSAATIPERCKILLKMQREETDAGHDKQADEIGEYYSKAGC